jgi:hypothetical protein
VLRRRSLGAALLFDAIAHATQNRCSGVTD